MRAQFLAIHPTCAMWGCGAPANEVDHIVPMRDRPDLRLAWWNLRALCKSHHSRKTAHEVGFVKRREAAR